MNCEWYYEEFCVKGKCPYFTEHCPVAEFPETCKYYKERKDDD